MDPRLEPALAALSTNPAEALRLADEVLSATQGVPAAVPAPLSDADARARVYAHRIRGQALRPLGRHAEAVEAFATAAAFARTMGDTRLAALVRVGMVDSLGMLGRFDEAAALAGELERDLRAAGAEEAAGKVLFNLGGLFYRQDRYRDALASFEKAGEIFARSPNAALLLPHVQTNTALALTFLDRTDEALALYQRAHDAFLASDMPVEAATVDANVGFLHFVSGRYVAALAALNRARETFRQQGRLHDAARYDIDAGDAYRALNLLPEARECYEHALEILRQLPLDYDEGRAHLGWAATHSGDADTDTLTAALNRAENIFRRQRVAPQRAHAELVKAALSLRVGDIPTARRLAESARRRFQTAGLTGWAAEATFITISAAAPEDAPPIRRLHHIRSVARRTGRGWLECRALHALGRAYAAKGDTASALRHLRAAVAVLEQVRTHLTEEELHTAFLSDKLAVYEELVAQLLARGRPRDIAEAFDLVEQARSRLLLERVLSTLPAEQTAALPEGVQARLADLRAQISRAYHQEVALGENEARRLAVTDTAHLAELERAYRQLLRNAEIEQRGNAPGIYVPVAGVLPAPRKVAALRRRLSPDACLIEYYAIGGVLHAFVLTRGGIHVQPDLCRVDDLEGDLRRLRFHLHTAATDRDFSGSTPSLSTVQGVLRRLYSRVMEPLTPVLPDDLHQVTIVPHGPLHRVPFHALYDGCQYLADRWTLTTAPSAVLWAALQETGRRPAPEPSRALVMGVPDPGIAQVESEVAEVAAALPGAMVFCGGGATLAEFRKNAPNSRILHLATHGLFRGDNPLFSGLRFADGWLLARDLYGLRLDADLVTLSACRTGMTEVAPGEELFGLLRGFLAAGARALVVSLWPADDAATARLMTHFYCALQSGKRPADALRAAQAEVRRLTPHPYYWAPFVVIGAP